MGKNKRKIPMRNLRRVTKVKRSVSIDIELNNRIKLEAKMTNRSPSNVFNYFVQEGERAVKNQSLNILFNEIQTWQRVTFEKKRDINGTLVHINNEAQELLDSYKDKESLKEQASEAADIIILLLQFCDLQEINIGEAVAKKFKENKARKWKKPNKQGVIEHVK